MGKLIFWAVFFAVSSIGGTYKEILQSPGANWLTYAGDYKSNRHSPLTQINVGNVSSLKLKWKFAIGGKINLRTTPLIYDGIMYATGADSVFALDSSTGAMIWNWSDHTPPREGINRGVAILNDKVFYVTQDCDLVALNYKTGKLIWRKNYSNRRPGYYANLAPLALRDRIIVGVSGGDEGARGFVAAFSPDDGNELWRVWTTPVKGEPGSETWGKTDPTAGGSATWMTGSYDAELNTVYWATGGPFPEFEGKERLGDNLYSNSVLAIDADLGKLKWYFQFQPHDTHHWDSNEALVLADTVWKGRPRKLLMQANRNGFFYVLDRVTGEFLSGKPFAKKLTWAKGLDAKGRPILMPGTDSPWINHITGICPGLVGATNWNSPSYDPDTGLFYVVTLEHCDMERGNFYLYALDLQTGNIKWEHDLLGANGMLAGALSTRGNLVFTGDNDGNFIGLNAKNGKLLWKFSVKEKIVASPMTYAHNGKQYVSIASGSDIFTFGLP